MGFFGFGKNDRVVDLGERYRKKESSNDSGDSDSFNILGNSDSSQGPSSNSSDSEFLGTPEENKRKLAKRLIDISNKLDEISTQIYHLQQRVELLERKAGVKVGA